MNYEDGEPSFMAKRKSKNEDKRFERPKALLSLFPGAAGKGLSPHSSPPACDRFEGLEGILDQAAG